jgi:exodeoxyribonuclease VII large subunit
VGHEIDVTLADFVADVRAATPTEAAERVVPDAAHIAQRLQWLRRHLAGGLARQASNSRLRLEGLAARSIFTRPFELVRLPAQGLDELEERMGRAAWHRWRERSQVLRTLAARLDSLSPLAVLARGYSITRAKEGEPLTDARQTKVGQIVQTRLARGELICRVEKIDR